MKLIAGIMLCSLMLPHFALAFNIKRDQIFLYASTLPQTTPDVGNVIYINADKSSTTATLHIPKNFSMNVLANSCFPDATWQSGGINGYVGSLAALPAGMQTTKEGLHYEIKIASWGLPVSSLNNFEFYSHIEKNKWDPNPAAAGFHQCWFIGKEVGIPGGAITPDIPVEITIARGTAVPGLYNLEVPVYWSYIEWKVHDKTTPSIDPSWPGLILTENTRKIINFPVIVTSKCNLDNYNAIQLNHGVMTPASALNNKTSATVNLTCTNNSTVNIKLLGNENKNKSLCGKWGVCELTFGDTGKSEEKLAVSGTKQLTIQSTFVPKTSEPVAGGFTSHGILEISVE